MGAIFVIRSTLPDVAKYGSCPKSCRDFTANAPNALWLADITEHCTLEGKLYVCAIKDVFSNRIVGNSIDSRMKSRIAVDALSNAVARRGDVAGAVLHSDRRSPFRSRTNTSAR